MAQYIEGSDRYQPMRLPAAVDGYVSSASPVRAIDQAITRYLDKLQQADQNEQPTMDGAPSDESPAYRCREL